MEKGNLFLISLFLLIFVISASETQKCPQNCHVCSQDKQKCEVCDHGYELNEESHLCEISYHEQDKWPGSCNTGFRQSPINIDLYHESLCPNGVRFRQITSRQKTTIHPEGQSLKAAYVDQSTVEYNITGASNTYKSLQFHWHHPSEHTVHRNHFDLELHIVHKNVDDSGKLAVTALFFNVVDSEEKDFFDKYNVLPNELGNEFVFGFPLKNHLVYHYEGSLTTPPCSEIVDWFVYVEEFTITRRNFLKIAAAINFGRANSREVQQIHEREIQIIGSFCNFIK